jgi:hypothetical protein
MRTTVTLDDDVVAKIKRKMQKGEGKTFKEAVNDTLRHGFMFEEQIESKPHKPFKVKARSLGLYPHLNFDKTSELLAMLDEEDYK